MEKAPLSTAEIRAIAKEAYIYGYPMVDSYRIQHAYFVNRKSPEFKAPWNQICNIARVFTPDDKATQTPNSDTPYSMAGLDLRSDPIVVTIPKIQGERYFSIQLLDAYTHNFAYMGSRTTGNGGGVYLVAGPGWKGEIPKGVDDALRSETEFVMMVCRTQLFNPEDLENVKKVQAGYKVETLSQYLGKTPAPAPQPVDFPVPLAPVEQKTSLEMFNLLSFRLEFCPTHPSESELMGRFAKIGVGPGMRIDVAALSPEHRTALEQGVADAWSEYAALKRRIDAGEVTSGQIFGTREHLQNNYLFRMAAALLGIFGNSAKEAIYPVYTTDAEKRPLTGERKYELRFAPGELPAVNAFWSLTMYELPTSLLVANPINRYLLNSTMLPQFNKDADGGLTLIIEHHSPGKEKEPNWLPAPTGPFMMALRLYWPKAEALTGAWKAPPLQSVGALEGRGKLISDPQADHHRL